MKKLVLLAAPPACGKNYVSDLICRELSSVAYIDKDDLSPLLRRAFAVSGEKLDMDGEFYRENLHAAEYQTLLGLAFSALRYSDVVLVNAPFVSEVRNVDYIRDLHNSAAEQGAELVLIWVTASPEVCRERMMARASDRDAEKLKNWEEYVAGIDFSAPQELFARRAVDKLFVFDNENGERAAESLAKAIAKALER